MTTIALTTLAAGIAAVSPDWAGKLRSDVSDMSASTPRSAGDATDTNRVTVGMESIREGWLLHRAHARLVSGASYDLELLIGDWCYAAGLCDIAEHGTLDDVARLADLITEVSLRPDRTVEELTPAWDVLDA